MRGREILWRLLSARGLELFSRTPEEEREQSAGAIDSCAEKREDICRAEKSSVMRKIDEAVSVFSKRRRGASFSIAKLGNKVVAKSKPILPLSGYDNQVVGVIDTAISRGLRHMDDSNAILKDVKERDRLNGSKVPESSASGSDKPAILFRQKGEFIYVGRRHF